MLATPQLSFLRHNACLRLYHNLLLITRIWILRYSWLIDWLASCVWMADSSFYGSLFMPKRKGSSRTKKVRCASTKLQG